MFQYVPHLKFPFFHHLKNLINIYHQKLFYLFHEDNFEILSYKKLIFLDNLLHIADNKEHLKKN